MEGLYSVSSADGYMDELGGRNKLPEATERNYQFRLAGSSLSARERLSHLQEQTSALNS